MIQLIYGHCLEYLIPNCVLCHIEPLEFITPCGIFTHPNQLDSSEARILPCIFCKTFCLPKIVLKIRIMWLQNINNIAENVVLTNNNKIRICWFCHTILFIGYAQRP